MEHRSKRKLAPAHPASPAALTGQFSSEAADNTLPAPATPSLCAPDSSLLSSPAALGEVLVTSDSRPSQPTRRSSRKRMSIELMPMGQSLVPGLEDVFPAASNAPANGAPEPGMAVLGAADSAVKGSTVEPILTPRKASSRGAMLRTRSGKRMSEDALAEAVATKASLGSRSCRQRTAAPAGEAGTAATLQTPAQPALAAPADILGSPVDVPLASAMEAPVPDARVAKIGAALDASAAAATATEFAAEPKPRRRRGKAAVAVAPCPAPQQIEMVAMPTLHAWTEEAMTKAMRHLLEVDPVLAPLIAEHGMASALIAKECVNVFDSLTRSILSQQLAVGAAAAITGRFKAACKCEPGQKLTPAAVRAVPVTEMRTCGLSGRKAEYVLDLARHFEEGLLSDEAIAEMDDEALIRELVKVKGIGRWTVDMFAMFHLGRPNVLPVGDLGVRKGMQTLYRLKALPEAAEMERLTDAWRPYRSLGSYYMWRVPTQRASSTNGKKKAAGKATTAVPTVLAE